MIAHNDVLSGRKLTVKAPLKWQVGFCWVRYAAMTSTTTVAVYRYADSPEERYAANQHTNNALKNVDIGVILVGRGDVSPLECDNKTTG